MLGIKVVLQCGHASGQHPDDDRACLGSHSQTADLVPSLLLGLRRSLSLLNAPDFVASSREPLHCLLDAAFGAAHLFKQPN